MGLNKESSYMIMIEMMLNLEWKSFSAQTKTKITL